MQLTKQETDGLKDIDKNIDESFYKRRPLFVDYEDVRVLRKVVKGFQCMESECSNF